MPQRRQHAEDAAADSLSAMLERERTAYACHDYLDREDGHRGGDSCSSRGRPNNTRRHRRKIITPEDRTKLVDWCYLIVDQCNFGRETVAVAMNLVDRFMSSGSHQTSSFLYDRKQYQLLVLTSLYTSIKIHERVVFGSADFAAMSNGTYSVRDIESMELRLLRGLRWLVCPPTPLQVGRALLELMEPQVSRQNGCGDYDASKFLQEELAYQTEVSVREYSFSTARSSTVAVAALTNAIEQLDDGRHQRLMRALVSVLRRLDLDDPRVLLDAKDRLRRLVAGQGSHHQVDEEDSDSIMTNADTEMTPATSRASMDESARGHDDGGVYYDSRSSNKRRESSLRRMVSSECTTQDDDDDSCITLY